MSITSVHFGRVSQNMQMNLLQRGMQQSMSRLLNEQEKLSSGLNILRPSDDPINATAVIRMESTLDAQQQYLSNIDHASKVMNTADSTVGAIYDLLNQAHDDLGLANVQTNLATADQRSAASTLVDSIIGQLVTLGNTQYLGSYIFAGRNNISPPYDKQNNTIQFSGDFTSIQAQVAPEISEDIGLTAQQVFGTGKGTISGYQDLAPAANLNTRLTDIAGGLEQGIRPGTVRIMGSVIGQVDVDISGADSLGDVIQKFNAALPASVQVALGTDGRHLQLSSTNAGETLSVLEIGHGTTAHDLGLYTPVAQASPITSCDLGPMLTLQTDVTALYGGAGIDLTNGIQITNGDKSMTLDFSADQTVQDVLNTINASGLGLRAQINPDRTGIEIVNLRAGARLTIGENGGTTADDLGIRTFRTDTTLADLNEGKGITPAGAGKPDFKITTSDGSSFSVAVSGAKTVQDIIDAINTAATATGVNLTASFATTGNGLVLTDNTGGAGTFKVERDPTTLSNVADELGILKSADAGSNVIAGSDVNPTKDESIFTYLLDFRDGLKNNDDQKIQQAVAKIESFRTELSKYHGKLGYMARGLETRKTQTEDAVLSTKTLVSSLKDLDYTEAITRFQNLQTTLQANLQTGGKILNMSLLDFLG